MSDTVRALETYWISNNCKNLTELRCKFCGAVVNVNGLEQLFYCPKCNELMIVTLPVSEDMYFELKKNKNEMKNGGERSSCLCNTCAKFPCIFRSDDRTECDYYTKEPEPY